MDMLATKPLPDLNKSPRVGSLTWWPDLGYGHDDTPAIEYGGDYWSEYEKRDASDMGRSLTEFRANLVRRNTSRLPVDIGIGAGAFVKEMGCSGYDVNPVAIDWLKARGAFINPYLSHPGCLTFWDSLEHIPDPIAILSRLGKGDFVFVSIPIFEDMQNCLASRHYKPGEHIWYWSHEGFLEYMARLKFFCLEYCNTETILGRDSVKSYAFVKR